jgi:hypothetical protein
MGTLGREKTLGRVTGAGRGGERCARPRGGGSQGANSRFYGVGQRFHSGPVAFDASDFQ